MDGAKLIHAVVNHQCHPVVEVIILCTCMHSKGRVIALSDSHSVDTKMSILSKLGMLASGFFLQCISNK